MLKVVRLPPREILLSLFCALAILASGCAGDPGSYKTLTPPSKDEKLASYTKLSLAAKKNDDVTMSSSDQQRIVAAVAQRIKSTRPNRFVEINPANPDSNTLHATVNFTRYEEGSAAARFFLAGLGQIHIDAEVLLENSVKGVRLATYEVSKTFAWGGIHGANTSIRDIEGGFVDAIVIVLVGEGS